MKVLIIGGSNFVGRHIVEQAVERGHTVTMFNRGKSNPGLFPSIEKIEGDRDKDVALLLNREWDSVIDTCGFFPRVVDRSVQLLKDHVKHYTFISTVSVYKDFLEPNKTEEAELATIEDTTVEEKTPETYGPLKVLCEDKVRNGFDHHLIVRPGFIVGPYDYSDRFTYWVDRMAKGDKVLAPGNREEYLQFIDARDLAEWLMDAIENQLVGTFNVTSEPNQYTFEDVLEECKRILNSDATLYWADDHQLEGKVQPFLELPFWVPKAWGEKGIFQINVEKVKKQGLKTRPLWETIRDTGAWLKESKQQISEAGMDPEKEKELILELDGDVY
ncbi:NAD-dependent epimerase/dehydratase family protein [Radiobacillus kanasensis]|uniref:NAD-dependent epimerase/dehydratase family protein n=1 Tax=Radiobacillus kanasensis TaxID=2844358 RepID=UPI001E4E1A92|nr:NAD-dependent epimerase/dehydratase family protein [Radiobacillus kanasensis]UFT98327.1 NAD-dependent epimerase/dehydratase family protein [Radiobacillus kanasensis]